MRAAWVRKPAFWTGCLVALGVGLRVYHYARDPSVWHDEAALILNVIGKNFTELLGPLLFSEGAPPLFLWIERAVFVTLGDGTFALRLVPFLASCLALVFLALVARRVLAAEAVPWVVLPFAVADTILWHSCEAKPYAVDLLTATTLLALHCYTSSWRLPWQLALYTILAPVFIFVTYPGCFLMGGLLTALLPVVWKAGSGTCSARWTAPALPQGPGGEVSGGARAAFPVWLAYSLLSFVVFVSFLLLLMGPIRAQRDGAMTSCWVDLFAPWHQPWRVPVWALASTLEIFRYCCPPAGQPLAILAAIGSIHLARRGQGRLLALILIPVLLAFFAACARAYPYGGARVLAYAAPGLLLLVGAGTPPALAWLRARSRLATLALFLFLLVPAGSALAHIVWPWGRADCAAASAYVLAHRHPDERIAGNTWECLYYFRHQGQAFQLWQQVRLPVSGRVWVVFSGGTPQDRLEVAEHCRRVQGRILDQQAFERTMVLLLEREDYPAVSEPHLLD
jgi:hypothetical protein